jgi:hypothetical protein
MDTEIFQQIALMLILLQFLNHFQEAIIPYFLLKYARKVKAAHPNSLILFSVLLLTETFCCPRLKLRRIFILLTELSFYLNLSVLLNPHHKINIT